MSEVARPLEGVRVLDLSRMLSGPFCTMLLADLGADVIKVEPPFGDMTRAQGPFADGDQLHEYGGYFQSVNRSKRGIVVDFTTGAGSDVVRRLARDVDILIENFRPGVLDRRGLSYEELSALNPRLIYATIRGFGDPRTGASPYQDWPSYDIVAQAMGGLLGITGPAGGPPTKTGPGLGDTIPSLFSAVGILAALHERETTGRGRFVDVAMYDAVLSACERIVYQYSYRGDVPGPEGNAHPLLCPFGLFPAKDGWISLAAAPADHHWVLLTALMGRPELGSDPRYATNVARVEHSEEVLALVGEWTSLHTRAELTEILGGQVPVGPVNTADSIVADPHVTARSMIVDLDHPGLDRPVSVAAMPIRFAGQEPARPTRAPLFGEHTREVLMQVGFGAGEVEALLATHVIHCASTSPASSTTQGDS